MAVTNKHLPPRAPCAAGGAPLAAALFRQLQSSVYADLSQGFFKKPFVFIITNKNASSPAHFFSATVPWELKNNLSDKPTPSNIITVYF